MLTSPHPWGDALGTDPSRLGRPGRSRRDRSSKLGHCPVVSNVDSRFSSRRTKIEFSMCLSTATFAYVGVETPAAAALEARPTKPRRASSVQHERGNEASSIGMTLRFSAQWISFLACAAYILSGILVSLSVNRHDCHLPRTGWLVYPQCRNQTTIESGFTLVPESRGNLALASTFNVFLVLTALSCANTNLYVASRTLFGLTNQLEGGAGEPWHLRVLAVCNIKVLFSPLLAWPILREMTQQ